MLLRRRCLLACTLCLLAVYPLRAGDDLATRIESVINGPDYREAHWGILVADAEDGRTLYAHDAERLFAPASTTKLYSCAAALDTFGADYRFETPVYRRGPVTKGVLRGDLILVASGDLTLGGRTLPDGTMAFTDHDHIYASGDTHTQLTPTDPLAGLKDLARQVAKAGIRRVDGEVLVDDRLFARARGSGSGPDVLSPVLVNDNVLDLTVSPGAKAGAAAAVRVRPETSFIQIDAQVTTAAEGTAARLDLEPVGHERYKLRGQVPAGGKPRVVICPVEDPAGFARALFIECLRREGVAVEASPLQGPQAQLPDRDAYVVMTRVARLTSPPLSEAIKVTLKVSHNLYASTMPLLIAAKHGKRTLADGMRLERKALARMGVDVGTVSFGGGAGGANADAVTPRATVQLLRAM
ncbi:MAG TPA: D-alanyl-D-alanine carboxypeptidase/D-alanyl-D-alanine-endopeptidase, partial [Gemmataceae bacterium]|nr:D-alanyl-D-alanine carboxypeptidase/D-alanyl-D-alanine-endopeptidase [Gemmataceae bacterium]